MSKKASGRRLMRSPLPLDLSLHIPGSSLNERRNFSRGDARVVADVETKKAPAVSAVADVETDEAPVATSSAVADVETSEAPATSASVVADVETRKSPALPSESVRDKRPPLASVPAPSAPPAQVKPPHMYPLLPVFSKEKRPALSRRKKIQLLLATLLLLLPLLPIVFELLNAFVIYRQVQDGIDHMQAVEDVFKGASSDGIANYFDIKKLRQAQVEMNIAHTDFSSLSQSLERDGALSLAAYFSPPQVHTVRSLGHIADEGTSVAQQLLQTMSEIAPSVAPALQKSAPHAENAPLKPYITSSSYQAINQTLDAISPRLHHIIGYTQGLSLSSLPISEKQRETLASTVQVLPALDALLVQRNTLQVPLGWLLGVEGPRTFLIEPMDRAELRATGGFTGQFGALDLNGMHMGPLKLSNIGKYEEDHTREGSPPDPKIYPKVVGQSAPDPYANWWPVENFGLRDANLSADFPTSARIAMNRYQYEFGRKVDGVIMFTPTLIKQILHVTGPISIPAYHRSIDEQNLENILHYYQLNNAGIRQEEIVEHVEDNQVARKLFTQKVTATLFTTVTHLPLSKMFALAGQMLHSMKSRDLQIYVTDPQLESLIGKYGSTNALDRSTSHDGVYIVQSNLSASKASQYVTTAIQDSILLDRQGGATHHLQMTLDYQQKGDVYGFDTYRDYIRIYTPVHSQLLNGNGFDQSGKPFCGDEKSGYRLCQSDVYGDGSLLCSKTIEMGYATAYLSDPYAGRDHPLDVTGPPQNQQSDEDGRAMFGGWVVIPKNCTMKITLSWYVPPMSKQTYSLLLQEQAAVYSPFNLTVQPSEGACVIQQGNALHFSQVMNGEDVFFSVKQRGSKCSLVSQ